MAAFNFPFSIVIKTNGEDCYIFGGSYSTLFNDINNGVPRGMFLGLGDDTLKNYELVEFFIDDGIIFARDSSGDVVIAISPDGSCEFVD